jgi:hypothetical protein
MPGVNHYQTLFKFSARTVTAQRTMSPALKAVGGISTTYVTLPSLSAEYGVQGARDAEVQGLRPASQPASQPAAYT